MKIRTMLVDDDLNAIEQLKEYLSSFTFIEVIAEASSGQEAILKLRENEVDLLFLDIEMGDMTGMDLAAYLKIEQIDLALIFVTGHPGFALEGYAYQPIDYLMKPIDFLRLERAVRTTKERIQKDQKPKVSDSRIGIKSENGIRILEVKSILFIEKKGRKAILNLKNGENVLSSDSMKNLEEIFLPFEFYRAHQSFLVSLSHIVAIYPDEIARSYTIEITSGKKIPLSRHKFANLKELLEKKGILLL